MTKIFLRGIAVTLPLALTAYVLYWLYTTAESAMGTLVKRYLETPGTDGGFEYFPGLGVLTLIVLIFIAGLCTRIWLMQFLIQRAENALERIPGVRTIYGAFRDLAEFVTPREENQLGQTVTVDVGLGDARALGFVTRESLPRFGRPGKVAVYVPQSYNFAANLILVPRSRIQPIDLPSGDVMAFVVSGGVSEGTRAREGEE